MQQFWKIYAWLFALLSMIGNVAIFIGYPPGISLEPVTLSNFVQSFVTLFGIVPVFLFAYQKRWLFPIFWKIFFFLFVFLEVKDIAITFQGMTYGPSIYFGIILTLPSYLAIFWYAFRFFKHPARHEKAFPKEGSEEVDNYVCVYTTNNEHDAQLIKMDLEGAGIKVILQGKSDVEAPNSFIHRLEIFVLAKDKNRAIESLSKFKA